MLHIKSNAILRIASVILFFLIWQFSSLFFDVDFNKHASEIYDNPKWPESPLFYLNFPSLSDKSMAPDGCENCFILIPIAPDLKDNKEIRNKYLNIVLKRIEDIAGEKISENIIYKKSFCVNDFISEYNSYKGNAYGLANTLFQTSIFKPKIKSKKIIDSQNYVHLIA